MGKYITWLKRQKRRDDPIGDFARDAIHVVKHPADWGGTQPNQSNDLREWSLAFSGASGLVQRAMVRSFLEYYGEVGFPRWYKKSNFSETDAESVLSDIWDAIEDSEPYEDNALDDGEIAVVVTFKRRPVSPKTRFLVFRRDNYRCQICGRTAQDGVILEVDHRVPVASNGSGELKNLWVLCLECNRGKAALSLDEGLA